MHIYIYICNAYLLSNTNYTIINDKQRWLSWEILLTMTDKGEAYMPMVNPAHKIPTKVSFTFSRIARSVNAITDPRNPTFSIATNFAVLI